MSSTTLRRALLPAARAAARQTTTTTSGSSLKTSLSQRVSARGYAADPNAPPKVPYPWNDPMNPSNWKEEHVVFAVLGGWGVVIYGAKTAFS